MLLSGLLLVLLGWLLWSVEAWSGEQGMETAEVVVIYAPDEDSQEFLDGIRLGVQNVNSNGGVAGLPLSVTFVEEPVYTEDQNLADIVADSLKLATRVSRDPDVLAVIGHSSSSSAVPASAVYDRNKKLFFATHATATSLNNHDFDHVFSLQPNNDDNARLMARYALGQGMRRFVVLSDDTSYGKETTRRFASYVTRGGAELLYRGGLTAHGRSIDRLILFMLDNQVFAVEDIDALFITSSSYADTARFIRRARELNLAMPILGPESLYAATIEASVGLDKMRGVTAVSLYDPQSSNPENRHFTKVYREAAGGVPDHLAALGYDAIGLLAFAAERAGSLGSSAMADTLRTLRFQKRYRGAAGDFAFDARGSLTDAESYIVRHDGSAFHAVDKDIFRGARRDAQQDAR
ncbi:ABC transporter substrate-binding protein [Alkalilimnicola sp. S0819]|uniref:ABC transporter substrate-binding protein n=1 Tax=Alkalilimnicola sp. S0819 TaxID=2613922 RepID=UPI001869EAD6|nr:ABC transporter substrate-binding protein [Alkalilimnicola sp. S0819]